MTRTLDDETHDSYFNYSIHFSIFIFALLFTRCASKSTIQVLFLSPAEAERKFFLSPSVGVFVSLALVQALSPSP